MTRQPDLFAPPAAPLAPAEPNLPFIRKSLGRYLRLLREAEIMPWPDHEVAGLVRRFPSLARALPEDERQALVDEFFAHLTRLGWRAAA